MHDDDDADGADGNDRSRRPPLQVSRDFEGAEEGISRKLLCPGCDAHAGAG